MKKAAFILNNRNKGRFVYRSVKGALSQTYPCEILIADFSSTDNSVSEIKRALTECPLGADHEVRFIEYEEKRKPSMRAVNEGFIWMLNEVSAPWVFQSSSDDYSLPERVAVCMKAAEEHPADGISTTCWFVSDDKEPGPNTPRSGYPTQDGYVSCADGIFKMAYGSTIWGYRREFLDKAILAVDCTLDVYLGALASIGKGFYVVATPLHVHYLAEDNENIGFQGKMRAAESSGDHAKIARVNELNRFQLLDLYVTTMRRAQELYPMMHERDRIALINMILQQANGWLEERKRLHVMGLTPEIL